MFSSRFVVHSWFSTKLPDAELSVLPMSFIVKTDRPVNRFRPEGCLAEYVLLATTTIERFSPSCISWYGGVAGIGAGEIFLVAMTRKMKLRDVLPYLGLANAARGDPGSRIR